MSGVEKAGDRKAGSGMAVHPAVEVTFDVTFVLPSQLRDLAAGRGSVMVECSGGTLSHAFQALRGHLPAVYDRIVTEQREIRPHINVFVDGADIRWSGGLDTVLSDGCEVLILRAVSGG